jgi:hypothetical protein
MKYKQLETFNEMTKVVQKKGEHGGNSMSNCVIHGENNSIIDWTKATKASRSELLHGVGYGTDNKTNELIEPLYTITKD